MWPGKELFHYLYGWFVGYNTGHPVQQRSEYDSNPAKNTSEEPDHNQSGNNTPWNETATCIQQKRDGSAEEHVCASIEEHPTTVYLGHGIFHHSPVRRHIRESGIQPSSSPGSLESTPIPPALNSNAAENNPERPGFNDDSHLVLGQSRTGLINSIHPEFPDSGSPPFHHEGSCFGAHEAQGNAHCHSEKGSATSKSQIGTEVGGFSANDVGIGNPPQTGSIDSEINNDIKSDLGMDDPNIWPARAKADDKNLLSAHQQHINDATRTNNDGPSTGRRIRAPNHRAFEDRRSGVDHGEYTFDDDHDSLGLHDSNIWPARAKGDNTVWLNDHHQRHRVERPHNDETYTRIRSSNHGLFDSRSGLDQAGYSSDDHHHDLKMNDPNIWPSRAKTARGQHMEGARYETWPASRKATSIDDGFRQAQFGPDAYEASLPPETSTFDKDHETNSDKVTKPWLQKLLPWVNWDELDNYSFHMNNDVVISIIITTVLILALLAIGAASHRANKKTDKVSSPFLFQQSRIDFSQF